MRYDFLKKWNIISWCLITRNFETSTLPRFLPFGLQRGLCLRRWNGFVGGLGGFIFFRNFQCDIIIRRVRQRCYDSRERTTVKTRTTCLRGFCLIPEPLLRCGSTGRNIGDRHVPPECDDASGDFLSIGIENSSRKCTGGREMANNYVALLTPLVCGLRNNWPKLSSYEPSGQGISYRWISRARESSTFFFYNLYPLDRQRKLYPKREEEWKVVRNASGAHQHSGSICSRKVPALRRPDNMDSIARSFLGH